MSELEIRKRQEYVRNRKKWMIVQIVAIVIVAAIALGSFLICDRMNRTYYIEYTESSNLDYRVKYEENAFFDDDWVERDQAYIAFLIDAIEADFHYELNMDTTGVGFDYSYEILATTVVADKDSGNPYYTVEEVLFPKKSVSISHNSTVAIDEKISIDYNKFNDMATRFVGAYGLKNASSTLIVTLSVDVLSACDAFETSNENSYFTSLNIPLNEETFSVEVTQSIPEDESKVLACSGAASQKLFHVLGIVTTILACVLAVVLGVFLYMTQNEDITYSAKVRKLVNAYGSYIQRITGEFDDAGYQTIYVKTFVEMLGIRDTIQSPILMYENRDATMTRFLVPTNTQLLYCFEIKVDNYDEIYSRHEVVDESEETVCECRT